MSDRGEKVESFHTVEGIPNMLSEYAIAYIKPPKRCNLR
jgi:hypothetical protein